MMEIFSRVFIQTFVFFGVLSTGILVNTETINGKEIENQMTFHNHFKIVSGSKALDLKKIEIHLEKTWQTFYDLFGVRPPVVQVVLTVLPGSPQSGFRADQERPSTGSRSTPSNGFQGAIIPWTVSEGEDMNSQGFNDLSHEIAHIYFLELMGNPKGLHRPHPWLHEAVACYHEGPAFLKNRHRWARDHIQERVSLEKFFKMKNPVKTNPLVELTTQLHEKLSIGEITVQDLNQQISAHAGKHAEDLVNAGRMNMTYYSQSLSLFTFLLEKEGKSFIRNMVQDLKGGRRMEEIIQILDGYPQGIESLEAQLIQWVQQGDKG